MDRVEISVAGGNGGHGAVSFRKEKYVPFGGPDGGNGGNGGDVVLRAVDRVWTLDRFSSRGRWVAGAGGNGSGNRKHGRKGEDLVLEVPVGTAVSIVEGPTMTLKADLTNEGEEVVVAKGGRGGRGNATFTTPRQQAPRSADPGQQGEEIRLVLEKKLMADVALLGYPSSGKSTLLRAVTAARPEVAAYPFTTREPVLGMVTVGRDSFFLVEIPALVEGAHQSRGLGYESLRHAERCRVIVHLLDGARPDPEDDWQHLRQEIALYGHSLEIKPEVVAVNKVDLPSVRERAPVLREGLSRAAGEVLFLSAETGEGVPELMAVVAGVLASIPAAESPPPQERIVLRPPPLRPRKKVQP